MEANIGDFVNDGYLSGEQADLVSDGVVALLGVVRPDAVALVDSFDFDDELELHNSAIMPLVESRRRRYVSRALPLLAVDLSNES